MCVIPFVHPFIFTSIHLYIPPSIHSIIYSTVPRMCEHGTVRIANGPNNYTGRVEFCYFGEWRTICGNNFDQQDAAVSCALAGFNRNCEL